MKKPDESCHSDQDQENIEHSIKSEGPAEETCQQGKTTFEALPMKVINNILSRLSVHSLLRCKSVNKLWKSLIEDKYFVSELHLDRSPCEILPSVLVNSTYILDSFCGLTWVSRGDPVKHYIYNPATHQILHLPAPNHAILRSPQTYKAPATARLKKFIAFKSGTHECKLLLEHSRTSNKGVKEHALETFEVGKDTTWRSIGRETGLLNDPYHETEDVVVVRQIHVRNMGVLHFIQVLMKKDTTDAILRVHSINVWDDKYVVNNDLPRHISFDYLIAHFIDCDDSLAIAEIIKEDLHLLKMNMYDGGDLRWSEQKMVVPLSFLSTEPYSGERYEVTPWGFKSDVLRFHFKNGVFDYDVKTKCIDKVDEILLPRSEQPREDELEYFPSLVKLEGMR